MSEDLVEALLASTSREEGQGPQEVFTALVYSTAAISQAQLALEALAEARGTHSADALIRGTGAAGLCGLALYLALSATKRHLLATSDPSVPFNSAELDSLVDASQHIRDSVVHWGEKLGRDANTFLAFNEDDLIVYAPGGRSGPIKSASDLGRYPRMAFITR